MPPIEKSGKFKFPLPLLFPLFLRINILYLFLFISYYGLINIYFFRKWEKREKVGNFLQKKNLHKKNFLF